MSAMLLPLVPLYAAATALRNLAYGRRWATPRYLHRPVVSIGNISVGGSGKTPLTIRLVQLLHENGIAVDVLSRGYGRSSQRVERVDLAGSAEEFGDEPLLIAQSTGAPVYVGASRYAAGLLAEAQNPATALHLLDDGFQHRRLGRQVDIVVLHRSDFSTRLLPAGRLREPFRSLRRAHILVLRQEDRDLEAELRRRGFRQPVWWMTRRLDIPPVRQALAFCAIARPDEFFSQLRRGGYSPQATRAWRDHHRYTAHDVAELVASLHRQRAESFVTTEKDLARLSAEQRRSLESAAPLYAARLALQLADEPECIAKLLALLPAPPPRNAP